MIGPSDAEPSSPGPAPPLSAVVRIVLLGRVILFGGAFATVAVAFSEGSGLGQSARLALSTWLAATISSLAGAWALRTRSRVREVLLSQLLFDQALWTVIVFMTGGVSSGATSLYGVTCLTGGLLLGVPGVLAAALAGGVFFSLMVVLESSGSLPRLLDEGPAFHAVSGEQVSYYFAINVLALVLVALLTAYLAERLSRAGGALDAAERRALEAERLATAGRLAAGLAHEIRNPLSSIAGAVQILSTSPLSEEDRELCGIVSREAGRLEDLVSDMLELSRPRPPHREDTDLLRVVSDVVVLAARSGRAFGDVSVRAIVPEGALIVSADGAQLRQLIWNLVRNAVQASAPGGEVRVRVEEVEGLVLSVEDDGEGIEGNSFEHLFDASYTTRSRGTGIGLAVVKRIADEHGFGLLVDSRAGQGATFRVVLASRRSSRPPTTAAARISVPPQR